jgi:hypothetical protein
MRWVQAELHVFYGFTESFMAWGARSIPNFATHWMPRMRRLLAQEGVVYHGFQDHATVATTMRRSGFALYPTTFPGRWGFLHGGTLHGRDARNGGMG